MTFDTNTPGQLKIKRNRKLPRREILDADFVLPSSSHVFADLLLERAPSQHDRSILSELWGGNAVDKNIMPAVSIGKAKRSIHNDSPTKPKTYKDMLKEKHKDEWMMDLSNLTFVPPTVKGKHIRLHDEIKSSVTSEIVVDNKVDALDDKSTQIDCLGAGNHNQFDIDTPVALEDDTSEIAKTTFQDTAMLQNTHHISAENHVQQRKSQSSSEQDDTFGESPIYDTSNDSIPDKNEFNDGYSDNECIVDQDILEKLHQLPIVIDQHDEIPSKDEIAQEPQTNISSSLETVQDQQLVSEASMAENEEDCPNHLKNLTVNLMPPIQFGLLSEEQVKSVEPANSIPLFDTTHDDGKEEDQEMMDEQSLQPTEKTVIIPTVPHLLVSENQNSWMISEKNVPDRKPLLNLDTPIYEAPGYIKQNPKIIEKWQRNQKKHRILNVLKGTTALNWKEDEKDDSRKKDLGFVRKRQLKQKFSQPFVIKKRIKSCWIVED